jgi:HK97 family phage prohead protease
VSDDTHLRTYDFRAEVGEGDGNTLEGYASVFDQFYDVQDHLGTYREMVARGAFRKTIRERTPVCMLDHGQHPLLGSLPLGSFTRLAEDSHGLHFRVAMHQSWIFEPVREAVRSGAIPGCSIRFSVPKGKDDWNEQRSERVIRETRLAELGPVVFPASPSTTVALRSLLSNLDDDVRATLLDEIGTRNGAVGHVDTPPLESPPEDEPIPMITRQARRRRGLILRGVIDEQAPGGVARQAG